MTKKTTKFEYLFRNQPYIVVDLLKKMLDINPRRRITAKQILFHAFIHESEEQINISQINNASFSRFDTNSEIKTLNEQMTHLNAYSERLSNLYQKRKNKHSMYNKSSDQMMKNKHWGYFNNQDQDHQSKTFQSTLLDHPSKPVRGILKNKYSQIKKFNNNIDSYSMGMHISTPLHPQDQRKSSYYEDDKLRNHYPNNSQNYHQPKIINEDYNKLKQSVKSVYLSGIKDNYIDDEFMKNSIFPDRGIGSFEQNQFKTETGNNTYKRIARTKNNSSIDKGFNQNISNISPRKKPPTLLEMKMNFGRIDYNKNVNKKSPILKSISLQRKESSNYDVSSKHK